MKVLLINPPKYRDVEYVREGRCMQPRSVWNNIWPPLTLNYLATILKKKHDVRLTDYIAENKGFEELKSEIKKFRPHALVINTGIPSIKGDLKTAETAKKIDKNIITIAYGIFPTLMTEETLNNFLVDYAVLNEPELTLKELIETLEAGKDAKDVAGIAYRKKGKIVITNQRPFIEDLDMEVGSPDRSLLKNEAYLFPFDKKPFALVSLARGCPYPCTFCVSPLYYGKRFRVRNPKKVVDEMEQCYRELKISNFMFWGESFTLDKKYGEKICDEIIRRGLKFKWITTSRVDTLELELLRKMKKAGCYLLGLGIESADEKILANVNKKTKIKDIENAIRLCKKAGIKTMAHFIFGFPGETRKSAEKTIRFAKICGVDYAQFYCAVPYPKTKFGEDSRKAGFIESLDWDLYEQNFAVARTKNLSTEEIMQFRTRAFKEFYFRPKTVINHLRNMKTPKEVFNTVMSGVKVIEWFKPKKKK